MHAPPAAAVSAASAKWKKAATAAGQAAVTVKRMQAGCISEAEAAALVARLSSEHGHALPEVAKSARALVMTARATRANVPTPHNKDVNLPCIIL